MSDPRIPTDETNIEQAAHGVITHSSFSIERVDYLYRVSLKCIIRNHKGEVLVVKEADRTYWDLPGGGMNHGEDIRTVIAREMKEEVNLEGDFDFTIIAVDEPSLLKGHNFWQLRLIFQVTPRKMAFSIGEDSSSIAFIDPNNFKNSPSEVERRIYTYYCKLA